MSCGKVIASIVTYVGLALWGTGVFAQDREAIIAKATVLPGDRVDVVIQTLDQFEKLGDASKLVPLLSRK